MKIIPLFLLSLTASLSTLCADVVVYRGTARATADLTTANTIPRRLAFYLLVDFDTREYTNIGFWNKRGVKTFSAGAPRSIDITTADISDGRIATTLATASGNSTDATNFSHSITYFRGKNSELLIQKEPATTRIARPRSLKGYALTLQANTGSGSFAEINLAFSYDQRATIAANDAGQTLAEATDAIKTKLVNKGYSDPF